MACVALCWALVQSAHADSFVIIVNHALDQDTVSKEEVSRLFLKKTTRWSTGEVALPLDLDESSPVRRAFSLEIHGRKASAIKNYWTKLIFSGRKVPPSELSQAEVIAYVRQHVGAIGYVSASAELGEGVKTISYSD